MTRRCDDSDSGHEQEDDVADHGDGNVLADDAGWSAF